MTTMLSRVLSCVLLAQFAGVVTAAPDDRAWKTPVNIDNAAGDAFTPQVSVDSSGTAVAVWTQTTDAVSHVWGSRYKPGRGWDPADVVAVTAGEASSPQVVIDPNRSAVAVWRESDGRRNNLWSKRLSFISGIWGEGEPVEQATGDASTPQLAIAANGDIVAVWSQVDGDHTHIRSSRSGRSGGWEPAKPVEMNVGDAFLPQVAVDPGGNALAVWSQFDGVRNNVWASRLVPGNEWGAPRALEEGTGDASAPQIAIGANSNARAVWSQFDPRLGYERIWSRSYSMSAGQWDPPEREPIDANGGSALSPQVAVDAHGNAYAVWFQHDGERYNVWSNRFVASLQRWEGPVLLETDNDGDALSPVIAIDENGYASAVWYQQQTGDAHSSIWGARYISGIGWSAAQPIERDNRGNAYVPRVALNANGDGMAVWYQSDGSHFNIAASRFAVRAWGRPTQIGTSNLDFAYAPRIALDASGNALAVWPQLDGTAHHIWSNRYDAAGGWGVAGRIDSAPTHAAAPRLVFDARGNAMAVWSQGGSVWTQEGGSPWWNLCAADGTWGTAAPIPSGVALEPQIAYDSHDDTFVVVAVQGSGDAKKIWSSRYAGGSWGTGVTMPGGSPQRLSSPQISFDSMGKALAVWLQEFPVFNIQTIRYTPDRGWATTVRSLEADSWTGHVSGPGVALAATGAGWALWFQDRNLLHTASNVWARRFDGNEDWGVDRQIDNPVNVVGPARIAADAQGNALVVWQELERGSGQTHMWAKRAPANGSWGPPEPIEASAGDPQSFLTSITDLAIDPNGDALVVWNQVNGTRDIWANRYKAGIGWGPAVRIETDAGNAVFPSVAFDASGNAMAVWAQFDGTRYNIWSNRFE